MKKHKPYNILIPSAICDVINGKISRSRDSYFYIIHYLLTKPGRDRTNVNGFVSVNFKKLKRIINKEPYTYIKTLEKYGLIENDKTYIKGKKSLYYRICPGLLHDFVMVSLTPESRVFKKIVSLRNKDRSNDSKIPFLNEMRKEFMKLSFDYNEALKWINNVSDERKRASYLIALSQLQDEKQRYFKRNKTNDRLDTNLTNLKAELKQFIIGNYVSIDLKNSQPFLLYCLIHETGKTCLSNYKSTLNLRDIPLCYEINNSKFIKTFGLQLFKAISLISKINEKTFFTDLLKYKDWVCTGKFYDNFVRFYDGQYSRTEVKEIMFKVLFSANVIYCNGKRVEPYAKEKKIFAEVFPYVYQIIAALKQKNNRDLPVYLQQLEAKLFIDTIAKQLTEKGIVPLTVHDSIIVRADQQAEALKTMQNAFKSFFDIVPQFKIEPLRKGD